MIQGFVLAATLIASVLPAPPHPDATPTPLKEIGHVHASAACAEIATHANSAITTALRDDVVLSQTIAKLRDVTLDDGNAIHRHNGLNALGDYAKTLMQQSRAGDREVQRLRELAAKSNDPTQKKDLKAFADVLGGALWRQQKVARDLNGFLAATDMRDMAGWDESETQANQSVLGVADPSRALVPGESRNSALINSNVGYAIPEKDPRIRATDEARAAATDFENRIPDISNDEGQAANLVTGAVTGC
ncbi:MAG: hypothetical protein M3R35_01390 [Candidatus Eremiobacteraeota bacterium]|nr:hypothetical protein [Candidatus Eremiobacteraeota bacterium]